MSWNNVMPAEVAVPAPKSSRGRKPSKWQLAPDGFSVTDGESYVVFDTEKKAKAALVYARAFGFIPEESRVRNY